jgi:hypothetical protein
MTDQSPLKLHQYLFWIILAAFSAFFAEVFSGSDMFPFFHSWGLLVVVPLYGLHIILLGSLVFRRPRPVFPSLVFAGMVFGLYEAYITKVLWSPPWGTGVVAAGIAPIETLVLVFWWHAWFSFIIPLLVAEKLLTGCTDLGRCLPGKLGNFLNSWGGLAAVMAFGGAFQSINSPSLGQSLLSGLSTTGVLVVLALIWKRVTRDRIYTMADLLPDRRQFRWLLIPIGILYLATGILLRPEAYPSLIGHLTIWALYGISFYLFFRSQNLPEKAREEVEPKGWSAGRWLLLAGIFPLSAAASELLISPLREILAAISWFGGIAFGLYAFITALKLTFPREEVKLEKAQGTGI